MTTLASALSPTGSRSLSRRQIVVGGLSLLLPALLLAAAGSGSVEISPGQILSILAERIGLALPWSHEPRQEHVLLAIRLPRVLLAVMVGSGLAVSGTMLQGLFRNPLADPPLVGVSSGAALAAVTCIVLGTTWLRPVMQSYGDVVIPIAAFLGGITATAVVYRIARQRSQTAIMTMLLAGIAVNALAGAAIGILSFMADDAQLRSLSFWSMGSLGSATWSTILLPSALILLTLVFAPRLARGLNAMLLGEAEAGHLGVDVERVKRLVIIFSALAVGASVATAGAIGFVGLVAPHLLRLMLGPDHRVVIPGSALLGASLVLGSDILARSLVAPAEIPIGIITALFGAPIFLWLLLRQKQVTGGS